MNSFDSSNIENWKSIISYDPESGIFTWLKKVSSKVVVGSRAGSQRPDGYRRITAYGCYEYEHRLAWAFQKGEWPVDLIDHEDFTPSNNAWENLRPATHSQNNQHRSVIKNKTGFRGVSFHRQSGLFHARLKHSKRVHCFGYHATALDAARVYNRRALEIQGSFAVLNEVQS